MSKETTTDAGHEKGAGHVSPLWLLAAVWGALAALTVLTVAAAGVDLGSANLWVAMGIATAKASLVALYFMHLRYERGVIPIVFLVALVFVMFMVSLTLMDTVTYQPDVIQGYAPALNKP